MVFERPWRPFFPTEQCRPSAAAGSVFSLRARIFDSRHVSGIGSAGWSKNSGFADAVPMREALMPKTLFPRHPILLTPIKTSSHFVENERSKTPTARRICLFGRDQGPVKSVHRRPFCAFHRGRSPSSNQHVRLLCDQTWGKRV